jgi:hypothetical protein
MIELLGSVTIIPLRKATNLVRSEIGRWFHWKSNLKLINFFCLVSFFQTSKLFVLRLDSSATTICLQTQVCNKNEHVLHNKGRRLVTRSGEAELLCA